MLLSLWQTAAKARPELPLASSRRSRLAHDGPAFGYEVWDSAAWGKLPAEEVYQRTNIRRTGIAPKHACAGVPVRQLVGRGLLEAVQVPALLDQQSGSRPGTVAPWVLLSAQFRRARWIQYPDAGAHAPPRGVTALVDDEAWAGRWARALAFRRRDLRRRGTSRALAAAAATSLLGQQLINEYGGSGQVWRKPRAVLTGKPRGHGARYAARLAGFVLPSAS
jgi:hypothetical protein